VSRPSLQQALTRAPVVLDGGLSTELEHRGHDVSGSLWSAALLREDPDSVVAAHRAFFDAGAAVATTAGYQATFEGFQAAGMSRAQAAELITSSVELAMQARSEAGRDGDAWVAASVGPYGAMLADGSEYSGGYAGPGGLRVAELRAFHRPRLELLARSGADVLACETVPCAAEAEALLLELADLAVPAWLSLTTVTGADGRVRTRLDEDAAAVFAMARDVDAVVAVGVNCVDPAGARAAVGCAATASGKPAVVYPNSGETWDAPTRTWTGRPEFDRSAVAGWLAAGARLVGGCCRVGPAQIGDLAAAIN
jgi:homocysteine S-methyltransferase